MVVAIPEHGTEAWHAERRNGVGGSDIPIIAGLSPYGRGVHDLYLEKRGEVAPPEGTEAMEAGRRLEGVVADWYADRTGNQVIRANRIIRHPDEPWAFGHLDRKVKGQRRLVEVKVTRSRRWDGGLPGDVECQVQWYMGVARYPLADVAALIAGSELQVTTVQADEAYFRDLLTLGREFWRRVQDGDPPDIDGSESAARYLANRYPWHQGEGLVAPTPEFDRLAEVLWYARTERADAEAAEDGAKNAIKALLGDAPGVQGRSYKVTWKRTQDSTRTDWERVARQMEPENPATYAALMEAATQPVPGSRRFLATFEGEPR